MPAIDYSVSYQTLTAESIQEITRQLQRFQANLNGTQASFNNFTQYYTNSTTNTVTVPTAGWYTNESVFTYRWPEDWQFSGNVYANGPAPAGQHVWTYTPPDTREQERAKRKARNLLKENLSAAQWKDFLKFDYFEIISESGAVYRIKNGRARNVSKIVDGEVVEVLCAHPRIGCPNEDTMLAQKLILETDENLFRKTANIEKIKPVKKITKEIPESYRQVLNALQIGIAA